MIEEIKRECVCCKNILPISEFYSAVKGSGFKSYCKECMRKKLRDYRRRVREAVLEYYGGECACCGEKSYEFLSMDHIDRTRSDSELKLGNERSGGGKFRRSSIKFYIWLLKYRPNGFRVLCHNCNFSLGHYGYCPHKKSKVSTSTYFREKEAQ